MKSKQQQNKHAGLFYRLSRDDERTNVDEFISRRKNYLTVSTLNHEMCLELIEFVTVDKCPGRYSKEP